MARGEASERKDKVIRWFKDPWNLALVVLLVLAFVIRIHYFNLTSQQAVWWDEGEYLIKAKNFAFGLPDSGWWDGRPILLPIILAVLFKIGFTEVAIKFLYVLVSTASVWLLYLAGKEIFKDKKIALIAPAFLAVFWLELVLFTRILTEIWVQFFVIGATYFYIKGIKSPGRYLYLAALFASFAFLMKWTAALLLPVFVLYFILFERKKLTNKKVWIAALIGIVIVGLYFIYNKTVFGKFLGPLTDAASGFGGNIDPGQYTWQKSLVNQSSYIRGYLGLVGGILFLISFLLLILELYIYRGRFGKSENKEILLPLFLFLGYLIFLLRIYSEDNRNLFPAIFAIFLLIAYVFQSVCFWFKNGKKYVLVLAIIAVIAFAYFSLPMADTIIKGKINGYADLKEAGLWLKQNSLPGENILSAALPQLTYYSEKEIYSFSGGREVVEERIRENNIKYMVLTAWEKSPDWAAQEEFVNSNKFILVKGYPNTVILKKD